VSYIGSVGKGRIVTLNNIGGIPPNGWPRGESRLPVAAMELDGYFEDPPVTRRSVSLIIPAKNEGPNLAWVLSRLPDCVDEVIVVDGQSTDATRSMAEFCRPDVRIIQEAEPGKGAALRAGFLAATGQIIVMMDADGSMSPEEIPRFLYFLAHGYDYVKGSRFVAGGGSLDITRLRRVGNHVLMALVRRIWDTQLTDLCYGFCAFHRRYLPELSLRSAGFEIETEMTIHAIRAGLRVAEVPSLELPRRSGQSRLHAFRDGIRVLNTVLQERDHAPLWPVGQRLRDRPARDLVAEPASVQPGWTR
jgi:glycosyltransferase involved in cell wall biosynthesis